MFQGQPLSLHEATSTRVGSNLAAKSEVSDLKENAGGVLGSFFRIGCLRAPFPPLVATWGRPFGAAAVFLGGGPGSVRIGNQERRAKARRQPKGPAPL